MDKNTWIGFGLIAVIIVGFMMCSRPSSTEPQYTPSQIDSIKREQVAQAAQRQLELEQQRLADSIRNANLTEEERTALAEQRYGVFANAIQGEEQFFTLENKKIRVVLTTKGGTIQQAELLEYTSGFDKENPLRLFSDSVSEEGAKMGMEKEAGFGLSLLLPDSVHISKTVNTADLYFTPEVVDSNKVVLRLKTDEDAWLDFEYELSEDYMVYYRIRPHHLEHQLLPASEVRLQWDQAIPQQEKGRKFEERYSELQYMTAEGDHNSLSASGNDEESENESIQWIAYKDQFFSSILIADSAIGFSNANFASVVMPKTSGYVKTFASSAYIPFDATGKKETGFRFYFGPNHYNTLKQYEGLNLKEIVPLGWKIVSWINKILVIPMFDLFKGWGLPIWLVIILMTLVIKIIILPFVFVSYKSSAKMKALRPQLNEINEKYGADKMRERQQATMELYRQAGVSPMSGCLPMLFQFPVLMAMFWFGQTAIEWRGESFLWADDLSTYDAVINFGTSIPLFGDHLSLFCLLMTIANFGYTYITMQSQATDPNMKFMKYLMYGMPIMFLFIFNDYPAGLSFYYLISLFITIFQTMIFRWTLNNEKMLAEIEENKKKRAGKPKSRFMQRLEKMQREQQQMARENAKKNMRH